MCWVTDWNTPVVKHHPLQAPAVDRPMSLHRYYWVSTQSVSVRWESCRKHLQNMKVTDWLSSLQGTFPHPAENNSLVLKANFPSAEAGVGIRCPRKTQESRAQRAGLQAVAWLKQLLTRPPSLSSSTLCSWHSRAESHKPKTWGQTRAGGVRHSPSWGQGKEEPKGLVPSTALRRTAPQGATLVGGWR